MPGKKVAGAKLGAYAYDLWLRGRTQSVEEKAEKIRENEKGENCKSKRTLRLGKPVHPCLAGPATKNNAEGQFKNDLSEMKGNCRKGPR